MASKITRMASAIPGPETVAHLGRYETMHSRELDRTMSQLAELQRRRTEDKAPGALVFRLSDFAKQTHRPRRGYARF